MNKNKIIRATSIILGDAMVATKTLTFAKIVTEIISKTNPIIGFIALFGMEHVYYVLGSNFLKRYNCENGKRTLQK